MLSNILFSLSMQQVLQNINCHLIYLLGCYSSQTGTSSSPTDFHMFLLTAFLEEAFIRNIIIIKKGKAVPLQAWNGPEGSRKLRFPDCKTTAQDDDKVRVVQRVPGS
jgi:hypothetical protein